MDMSIESVTIENLSKRISASEIEKENTLIQSFQYFTEILNSLSTVSLVLNQTRQVISVSNDFLDLLNLETEIPILGSRLGEIISCIHSSKTPAGCGTTETCSYCGAGKAILECQISKKKVQKEARITSRINNKIQAWDLMVTAVPLSVEKREYYIITINDISSTKRKANLEAIFFHDLVNIAGGINSLSTIINHFTEEDQRTKIIDTINKASQSLLGQILSHKQFIAAENGNLVVKYENEVTTEIIKSTIDLMSDNEETKSIIKTAPDTEEIAFSTDKNILSRILLNMIKNAVEANDVENSVIMVGSKRINNSIRFWVQSDKLIQKDVQHQIFQRSFSSKGKGRGLGTYSMKLLGETYLGGNVGFCSNRGCKTIFYIDLPAQ